jgi:hypothetical protein
MNTTSLHFRQCQLVNTRGTTILTDSFPCFPQDVTPVDTIAQRMETPTLRLLGSSP